MQQNTKSPVRFGPFSADLHNAELSKYGFRLKLQRQPFEILAALLERPGETVSREDLRKRLWPDGVFVDYERGMNKAVNRLREVLNDDADEPRFIETIPQRGYRFIGTVEPAEPLAPAPASKDRATGPRRWWTTTLILILAAVAILVWRLTTVSRIESIAVLPLENLSSDRTQEFFADGMTDELIGELAQIATFRVTSRTSVMRYKGSPRKSLAEIARELSVDAIVEGTVTRDADRVRVTAQLIRARDDRHIWSGRYERDLRDILTMQGDVARAIAMEVGAKLAQEKSAPRRVNPEAHLALLQASYFLHQNIRGIPASIAAYRRAIELDPSAAEAHAGLAQALIFAGIYEIHPFAKAYEEAGAAARKAVELDGTSAAAYNALADVRKGLEWNLPAAMEAHRTALKLNPSHLLSRLWYGETLSRLQRHDEALAESARAVALDPVSALSHNNRAMLLWRARRYDEALRECRIALDLDPSHANALLWQGLALAGRHDFAGALASLQKGFDMTRAPLFLGSLGYVHGLSGDRQKAKLAIDGLREMSATRYVSPTNVATVYAGLGDADEAFAWLEKSHEAREGRVHQLVTPLFDRFREDPRYADLKRRTGLL